MKTKEDVVKEINELYANNSYAVVVDFKGLNATDTSDFRGALKYFKQDWLKRNGV